MKEYTYPFTNPDILEIYCITTSFSPFYSSLLSLFASLFSNEHGHYEKYENTDQYRFIIILPVQSTGVHKFKITNVLVTHSLLH